jgi:HSP20 family protein
MSNLIPGFGTRFDGDIDNLFRTVLAYGRPFHSKNGSSLLSTNTPLANVASNEEGYTIELAAPGFSRNDFNIDVENNVLTVTGTSYGTDEKEISSYTSHEFSCSSFTRTWSLPDGANVESVAANYEAGILNIRIPVEGTQKKKFSVSVE